MKPALSHFFHAMGELLLGERTPQELLAAHPGWQARPERLALYASFVEGHVVGVLEKLFPLCRGAMPEAGWRALCRAYFRCRPARHFELNRAAEGFPAFVTEEAALRGLPPFLPALARLEWVDFAVSVAEETFPEGGGGLTVNPTLAVLEHSYRLCEWVSAGPARPVAPRAGSEMALLWRHPTTLRTMLLAADERVLLVLKMAFERLDSAAVAAAGGPPAASVDALVGAFVEDGLVCMAGMDAEG